MTFGKPPQSTPLEEAMKAPEVDEYSEEQLKLIEMNIPTSYIKGWFKKNPKALTAKGKFRRDFFDYLMKCCSFEELNNLVINSVTPKQQPIIDRRIKEGGVPESKKSNITEYIDKNQELLQEKDELFKKVAELQEERDNLQKKLDNVGAIQEAGADGYIRILKMFEWLYDFMGNSMDFADGYIVEPDDLECIKEIKKVLGKNEKSHTGGEIANIMIDNELSGGLG